MIGKKDKLLVEENRVAKNIQEESMLLLPPTPASPLTTSSDCGGHGPHGGGETGAKGALLSSSQSLHHRNEELKG